LSALTIVWRVRSGVRSWTLSATMAGLITGIRPTREGLTRKGVGARGPHRPAKNWKTGHG
jgi:hypothetical protein